MGEPARRLSEAPTARFVPPPENEGSLVRVLSKGLHLLRVLNEHCELTALELCRLTGIPRPTVHRLLNTLIADGYVTLSHAGRRYQATVQAQALGQGYREEAWVADIARPILRDLQRELVWPSDVATYRDGAMVIRQTTNSTSPVSIVGERVGSRISVLRSALGRAYLGFSEPGVRDVILDILAAPDSPDHAAAQDRHRVIAMLDQVRGEGFAERVGGIVPRTFSLATPIVVEGRCFAALNVICFSSALKIEQARADVLPALQAASQRIADRLAAAPLN